MPRFLLPAIATALISVIALILTVFFLSPVIVVNRIIFLGLLQITLTTTLSLIFYKIASLSASLFTEPRYLYRKLLRRALLVTAVLTISVGFKFWGGLTPLNVLLLIVFLGVVEAYISYSNK